jgi:hypothetical protein
MTPLCVIAKKETVKPRASRLLIFATSGEGYANAGNRIVLTGFFVAKYNSCG